MPDNKPADQGASPAISEQLTTLGYKDLGEVIADVKKAREDRDKALDMHKNAEKKIFEQGAELGELRKKVRAFESAQPAAEGKAPSQPPEETLEQIEASLTPEQKAAADAAFAKATDEERAAIYADQNLRKQFLQTAKSAIKVIPKSLFDKPTVPSGSVPTQEAIGNRIKELFGQMSKNQSLQPVGPSGTASTAAAPRKDDTKKVSLKGGVLGALADMKHK